MTAWTDGKPNDIGQKCDASSICLEPCATWDIHPKEILNSNFAKTCLPITYFSFAQLFKTFAQNSAVILPLSVQNFKRIGRLKWTL